MTDPAGDYRQYIDAVNEGGRVRGRLAGIPEHLTDDAPSSIATAGRIAAHTVRLTHPADHEVLAYGVLHHRARAIDASADYYDWRMVAALEMRRALAAQPGHGEGEAARLVSAWLAEEPDHPIRTGHLCRWVVVNGALSAAGVDAIAYAWISVHGVDVVEQLRSRDDRDTLRTAVAGCYRTGMWTKVRLAEAAGISRPTLDAWLANTWAAPG